MRWPRPRMFPPSSVAQSGPLPSANAREAVREAPLPPDIGECMQSTATTPVRAPSLHDKPRRAHSPRQLTTLGRICEQGCTPETEISRSGFLYFCTYCPWGGNTGLSEATGASRMRLQEWMRSPELPRVATPRTVSTWPLPFPAETGSQLWRAVGRPDLTARPLSDPESPDLNDARIASPIPSSPPPPPPWTVTPLGMTPTPVQRRQRGQRADVPWPALSRPRGQFPHLRKAVSNTEASPREALNSWGGMGWPRGQDRYPVKPKRPTTAPARSGRLPWPPQRAPPERPSRGNPASGKARGEERERYRPFHPSCRRGMWEAA